MTVDASRLMTATFLVRLATVDDIPTLVSHRRKMFVDMAALEGKQHDRAGLEVMDNAYAVLLRYDFVELKRFDRGSAYDLVVSVRGWAAKQIG